MRFKNIALVYECDDATLTCAATLARHHRARLTLVHVITRVPDAVATFDANGRSVDVRALIYRDRQSALREAARSIVGSGVRPRTRLLIGEPFIEIIRDVAAHDRDLVVMTADGHRGLRRRLLGSTASHLVRKCPVPVLVVKPGKRGRFQRVAVAVDPGTTEAPQADLNRRLLELGGEVAERDNAELHVVHAWQLLGEAMLRGRGGLSEAEVSDLLTRELAMRRAALEPLLRPCAMRHPHLHLLKGHAPDVVPRFVERERIDLLVMGSVSRTGIAGVIIGNTAERILDAVQCSLLVVKPEGFVSPVMSSVSAALPPASR
ncbi:MAG: universal stress protein [Dehalococcoidia bacterium]